MSRADGDDIDDLTQTDFFSRARWAQTGRPFDPVAYARHELNAVRQALEATGEEDRARVAATLDHVRRALRALDGDAA